MHGDTVMPQERVGLGIAAAAVAVLAALVVAVALSGYGPVAAASTVLLTAGAARAYGAASGGRLQRGVALLVMLVASGTVATVGLLVFVDAWHAYDLLGEVLGVRRDEFLRWALTSPAVLADYGVAAAVAAAGAGLGALTAVPRIRATLRAPRPTGRPGEPTAHGEALTFQALV